MVLFSLCWFLIAFSVPIDFIKVDSYFSGKSPRFQIFSGDIAYYDDDGHYFVVDRLKDIIKYKGYQISPTYLESILLSHEAVLEAAVVGVPADVFGEVPKAYVVLKSHAEATEIQKYINERVSPYKKLRGGLEIVDEIPKLPSGKILRRKLPQTDNGKENLKINY
ncbi:Hypothetical predicted protein [Mytilus galloprovincialis]|uniref:AMP-binding enzyme C-terminal domain-containing protein n=1 Tax=Mytilus galloprovincialis TaxID=29158 RepID=A0A8B6GC47_MYTGA|nr:Hypothetical predicted protein [Mytilus galloprovincialis]